MPTWHYGDDEQIIIFIYRQVDKKRQASSQNNKVSSREYLESMAWTVKLTVVFKCAKSLYIARAHRATPIHGMRARKHSHTHAL